MFWAGCALITLLQAARAGGLKWFDGLAYKRGGVNHHVAYRKRQYNQTIFTEENVAAMKIALGIFVAVMVALLLWLLWKRAGGGALICGLSALWAVVLLWQLTSESFKAVRIYPYAILGAVIALGLELVRLILWAATRARK